MRSNEENNVILQQNLAEINNLLKVCQSEKRVEGEEVAERATGVREREGKELS